MKKVEEKNKFELTAKQFEEFIMPFIEKAKKECKKKGKINDFNDFKVINIRKLGKIVPSQTTQDYRIDFDTIKYQGYLIYSIYPITDNCYLDSDNFVEDPVTNCLVKEHKSEISEALMKYFYSLYGEEYKDWLIQETEVFAERRSKELDDQIADMKKIIEDCQKRLGELKKEQIGVKLGCEKGIKRIGALLNHPYQF